MKEGALLVNAGRGPVVDTDALVAAVRAGRIRAALDVTDPEPLPEDHVLWTLDGVFITPHNAGDTPGGRAAPRRRWRARRCCATAPACRCTTWSVGPHALGDELDERVELGPSTSASRSPRA